MTGEDEDSGMPRRGRGALEREVLEILAAAPGALSTADVRAALADGGRLSYTTVLTALTRLHAKGALLRARSGRAYRYRLAGDSDAIEVRSLAARMRRLLDAGGDRKSVLARFVEDLDPADEAVLLDLLRAEPDPAEPRTEPEP